MGTRAPISGNCAQGWRGLVLLGAAGLAISAPALATQPSTNLTADAELRFGSFVVIASGARTVSPSGVVTDQGIFPINSAPTGPAQFTVSYDRGNNSPQPYRVEFQLVMSSVSRVTQSGVTGTLSSFTSDLPGFTVLVPGQAMSVKIENCTTRVCSMVFHVGARIDVTRASGGAALRIPLPMNAVVLTADRM